MDLSTDHIIFQSENDIRQICKTLFDSTPIIYFEYARYYKNGDFWEVNTNSHITQKYLEFKCHPHVNELAINTAKYSFMSKAIPLSCVAKQAEEKFLKNIKIFEDFNIDHRIYIDNSFDTYYDACGFGTNLNASAALDFFFNNLDLLNKFKEYFFCKGKSIIASCDKNRVTLFPEVINNSTIKNLNNMNNKHLLEKNNFLKFSLPFVPPINNMILSNREYICLQGIAHGKTTKQIANDLSISSKTVQTHIDRIKTKFKCSHKSILIDLYWNAQH